MRLKQLSTLSKTTYNSFLCKPFNLWENHKYCSNLKKCFSSVNHFHFIGKTLRCGFLKILLLNFDVLHGKGFCQTWVIRFIFNFWRLLYEWLHINNFFSYIKQISHHFKTKDLNDNAHSDEPQIFVLIRTLNFTVLCYNIYSNGQFSLFSLILLFYDIGEN